MSAGPVRWGVLGVATIALRQVIPALQAAVGATPLAIASRDLSKARATAGDLGIPRAYGDYQALLDDPDIEAIYIPLPNTLHVDWCLRALAAGKHVLCEKPLALSSVEIERLIAARDASGRHIEEGFAYRNHPQWSDIATVIDSAALGAPVAAHAVLAKQFHGPADIRNDPTLGGGALYDLGTYATSAMNAVFRRSPQSVSAVLQIDPAHGVDVLSSAIFDYGDAQATFTVGIRSGPSAWGTHQSFSMLASKGWLACDFPFAHARPSICHLHIGDESTVGSQASEIRAYAPHNHYLGQVERFSAHVRGEPVKTWPIEDALMTLRIIEALFAAGKSGQAVRL